MTTLQLLCCDQDLAQRIEKIAALADLNLTRNNSDRNEQIPANKAILQVCKSSDEWHANAPPIRPQVSVSSDKKIDADFYLPGEESHLLAVLDQLLLPKTGQLIVVAGVTGGIGTSVIAAALARLCAKNADIALLDWGTGGTDFTCGIEDQPGLNWNNIPHAPDLHLANKLPQKLQKWGRLHLLSGPACPQWDVVKEVTQAIQRAFPLVIVDTPISRLIDWELGLPDVLVCGRDLRSLAALNRLSSGIMDNSTLAGTHERTPPHNIDQRGRLPSSGFPTNKPTVLAVAGKGPLHWRDCAQALKFSGPVISPGFSQALHRRLDQGKGPDPTRSSLSSSHKRWSKAIYQAADTLNLGSFYACNK